MWIAELRGLVSEPGSGWRIEWREAHSRVLGVNALPEAVWLDSTHDALTVLRKHEEAQRVIALAVLTAAQQPALQPWVVKNAPKMLALEPVWPRLLAVVAWIKAHPRSGLYLRQVSVPGVAGIDSKFIEKHRSVLAELLDLVLPEEAIDARHSGVLGFAASYGFRAKPLRVRFRLLDPAWAWLAPGSDQDITLTQAAFAALDDWLGEGHLRVFITENEVNFLAFPDAPRSVVVFGAGYGFDNLLEATWLQRCPVYYWGDIDTHGFAILDQLRALLPHAQSLLMDAATLMAHQPQWGEEPQPVAHDLPRLTPQERALYDDLRHNRPRAKLRLEQERVDFQHVQRALLGLPKHEAARRLVAK